MLFATKVTHDDLHIMTALARAHFDRVIAILKQLPRAMILVFRCVSSLRFNGSILYLEWLPFWYSVIWGGGVLENEGPRRTLDHANTCRPSRNILDNSASIDSHLTFLMPWSNLRVNKKYVFRGIKWKFSCRLQVWTDVQLFVLFCFVLFGVFFFRKRPVRHVWSSANVSSSFPTNSWIR